MWSGGLPQNLADNNIHVVSIVVFVALLCLCIVIGHLLEENRWVTESITAILIGCLTGTIILLWSKGRNFHILRFNQEFFFIYLLPPIIFNAGFQVKKKQFFRNFLTIMLFGVVGVFISSAIIAAGSGWLFPKFGFSGLDAQEYLGIGTIFSSTDTVCTLQVLNQDETPLLYSLVFGEGVVNDATSVVLFNAVRKLDVSKPDVWAAAHVFVDFLYLFIASTVLGVATGLLTAYALKSFYFGRHSTDREIALMALMAYLSYMLAELLQLSGILTVFFCGIVMSHYAWYNVTENSRTTTRHMFATMSFIAETFIFLYVGMDSLDIEKWRMSKTSLKTSVGICSTIIFLTLLGRAAFVFPLSVLSNYMNGSAERTPITFKHQIIIWWAGLMRGAVSIALAFTQFTFSGITWNPVHATMVTSTVIVVLFTTLVNSTFNTLTLFVAWEKAYVFIRSKICSIGKPLLVFGCKGKAYNPRGSELYLAILFPPFPCNQMEPRSLVWQVFGFLTKPLINVLLPHSAMENHHHQDPISPEDDLKVPLHGSGESVATNFSRAESSLSMLIERPVYTIHFYWRKFDNAYMRPIFGGAR